MNRTYHYRDASISVGVESIWTSAPNRKLSLNEMYSCRVQVRYRGADTLWESGGLFPSAADALVAGFREGQQLVDEMLVVVAR
jgi:hypothetical protein